jgi:cytochrome c oxidase cbb3-type subunit III
MRRRAVAVIVAALAATGCERETRMTSANRVDNADAEEVALSPLSPGGQPPIVANTGKGRFYERNANELAEGKRLFTWFNCAGCHGNGGGGSGPALMDDKWIYGASIENIAATIREGRPNGMPSFRGKVPEQQIWQLSAFVRSLGGQVTKDAAPSREDNMSAHPAENRLEVSPPVVGGTPAESPGGPP